MHETVSVVIPAHNEERHLGSTVRGIHGCLERERIPVEIIIINDLSTDGTRVLGEELAQEIPGLRVIDNQLPRGFGGAVRTGLSASNGKAVGVMMADGCDDPEDLISYVRKFEEGYDCIFGSRFMVGGRVVDYPFPKRIANRLANHVVQRVFRTQCDDITNAFKLYASNLLEQIGPLRSRSFELSVELPLKALATGASCAVIPISWTERRTDRPRFRLKKVVWPYLRELTECWRYAHEVRAQSNGTLPRIRR